MPTYYTDPSIAFQTAAATDPWRIFSRYAQLKQLKQHEKRQRIEEEEAQIRLEELKRGIAQRNAFEQAVRSSMGGGGNAAALQAGIAPTMPGQGGGIPGGGLAPGVTGVMGPGAPAAPQPAGGGGGIDTAALLQNLSQVDPMAALKMQGGFAQQGAELEKTQAQTAQAEAAADKQAQELLANKSKDEQEAIKFNFEIAGRVASSILEVPPAQRAQAYDGARTFLLSSTPAAQAIGQAMPPQYSPELDTHLQQAVVLGQSVKDYAAGKEKSTTPGVDVPFSPEVAKQKADLARAGRSAPTAIIQTVDEQGKPVTRIVPKVAGSEFAAGPTADMRNRAAARQMVIPAVDELQALGSRVITEKLAVVQKAKAAGRSVEAALANDPDFRVYQDARLALAGNLAVLQQGSRPSDADIKAIWEPLVPNVFKDTQESSALKWKMIRTMSGIPAEPADGGATGGQAETREYNGYEYTRSGPDQPWVRGRKLQ